MNPKPSLGQMAYNVPVVYDGFVARISETAGFAGLQNCGWRMAWERAKRLT